MENQDERRYIEVKEGVTVHLKQVGYSTSIIHFVPVSALEGDNLVSKSQRFPWYNGPTVVEALDLFEVPKIAEKPLRIPIQVISFWKILELFVQEGTLCQGCGYGSRGNCGQWDSETRTSGAIRFWHSGRGEVHRDEPQASGRCPTQGCHWFKLVST